MAILIDADRIDLRSAFAREASSGWIEIGLTKTELKTAVDAIDQWVEDNQASFNSAIPTPARTALSVKQKVQLLFYIIRRRWGAE